MPSLLLREGRGTRQLKGFALVSGELKNSPSIWENRELVKDKKPIFAVTEDFIEYNGMKITKEDMKKIIALII